MHAHIHAHMYIDVAEASSVFSEPRPSLSLSLSLPPSLSVKQRGGLIKASGPHVSSAPVVEVNIHR